ncbi:MAG TPA: M14-type cytosolic carboxypeptidase [Verrucomicrobiae bacterium]|nr:M14-type cytosolic carboxypeptidase [Verrucomicrobiae bacterium]
MKNVVTHASLAIVFSWTLSVAQEVSSATGWQMSCPTENSHRLCLDMASPHGGKASGKIIGADGEKGARGCFIQEFYERTAIPNGKSYRYSLWYRTDDPLEGSGQLLIDCYAKEGEKSHRSLVAEKLGPTAAWREVTGEVAVPADAVRVRILLYLRGKGTIWYDDTFFGDTTEGAANLLKNGGFEPADSAMYDLMPERASGSVRFFADFENATLGRVKQIGPDEFYLHAFPEGKPRSSFLWFHFRVEGCEGREITFHINPSPFSREKTSGNGTRSPVMSYDGDNWLGIEDKSWSDDGSVLTFKQRFSASPAWVASFFPFTAEHITRFIDGHKTSPYFKASILGQTKQGRDMRMYTITDPAVQESGKRAVLFTTLHHDLETTGAMALEGICRFLLSDDPRADKLRRAFVFHVVPMMDPDGIAQGNLYCPVGNLNRQWGLGTTAETACVERFVRELGARGRKVELFMDFHGWCTPERTTLFMTFGKEIADEASETDAVRLAETIRSHLIGKVNTSVWRKRVTTVTGITGDLNRLSAGWMKFEAGARLAYSIEIFGEGTCDQQGYVDWGRAFAEGIAEFYGMGGDR